MHVTVRELVLDHVTIPTTGRVLRTSVGILTGPDPNQMTKRRKKTVWPCETDSNSLHKYTVE